jgi:peroxiredoxin
LADFEAKRVELDALNASVFALSTDPLEQATITVEQHGLSFPVIHGVDGPKTAELLRTWYEERRNIVQPTNFILNPKHEIVQLSMAMGPIGRFTVEDVLRNLKFMQDKAAEAAAAAKKG